MGKKTNTVIITLAVAGLAYIINRFRNKSKKDATSLAQAIVCMEEKYFEKALSYLNNIKTKNEDILLKIATCHAKSNRPLEAINYIDKCNTKNPDIHLLEKRFFLNKKLNRHKAAFKDVFMLNMLDQNPTHQKETSECLKRYSDAQSFEHKITGQASNINFKEFFDTIFFLDDLSDPIAVFLKSGEYSKCYEYVKDSSSEPYLFFKGCFSFVNGDWDKSVKFLSTGDSVYSKVLCMWLKTHRDNEKMGVKLSTMHADKVLCINSSKNDSYTDENIISESEGDVIMGAVDTADKDIANRNTKTYVPDQDLINEWYKSDDPTVLFYLSRIFENLDDQDQQIRCIDKCIQKKRTAAALSYKIIMLIKQQNAIEASRLIDESLKEFPDDIHLFCIAIEYFLIVNCIQRAYELLYEVEKFESMDVRVFILKFIVAKAAGNIDIAFLRTAIKMDSLYFKSYIYLGKQLLGTEESLDIFEKALSCARNYGELHAVFQLKAVVDMQNELLNEYPQLFEK